MLFIYNIVKVQLSLSLSGSLGLDLAHVDGHVRAAARQDGLGGVPRDVRHRAAVPGQLVRQRTGLHIPDVEHAIAASGGDARARGRPAA